MVQNRIRCVVTTIPGTISNLKLLSNRYSLLPRFRNRIFKLSNIIGSWAAEARLFFWLSMNILSWNLCGLGNDNTRRTCAALRPPLGSPFKSQRFVLLLFLVAFYTGMIFVFCMRMSALLLFAPIFGFFVVLLLFHMPLFCSPRTRWLRFVSWIARLVTSSILFILMSLTYVDVCFGRFIIFAVCPSLHYWRF